jgi:hypothetical protein
VSRIAQQFAPAGLQAIRPNIESQNFVRSFGGFDIDDFSTLRDLDFVIDGQLGGCISYQIHLFSPHLEKTTGDVGWADRAV